VMTFFSPGGFGGMISANRPLNPVMSGTSGSVKPRNTPAPSLQIISILMVCRCRVSTEIHDTFLPVGGLRGWSGIQRASGSGKSRPGLHDEGHRRRSVRNRDQPGGVGEVLLCPFIAHAIRQVEDDPILGVGQQSRLDPAGVTHHRLGVPSCQVNQFLVTEVLGLVAANHGGDSTRTGRSWPIQATVGDSHSGGETGRGIGDPGKGLQTRGGERKSRE
jgi:hypothetical protein